jgi:hypothetical protein
MDVEPTAQIIDWMATRFRNSANELDRIANRMREKNDLTCASEALSEVINAIHNSRLDLLVSRPIRAMKEK